MEKEPENIIINSKILKLSGLLEIPDELRIGYAIELRASGQIINVTYKDNQDGSVDVVYCFKPAIAEYIKETGEVTKTRDARSRSKQLRATIRREWIEKPDIGLDENTYYDQRMAGIIKRVIEGEI